MNKENRVILGGATFFLDFPCHLYRNGVSERE